MNKVHTVLTRSPLRISFVGGGSDLPAYENGRTLSTSIDKYVYCMLRKRNDNRVIVHWKEMEDVGHTYKLQHEIIKRCLISHGILHGVEISMMADVPGVGSGLGSSAATTCAVLMAIYATFGIEIPALDLAREAAKIEMRDLGRYCGPQDHYASAVGGFLDVSYICGNAKVDRKKSFNLSRRREFARHFMLFSPRDGNGRNSDDILRNAKAGDPIRVSTEALARSVFDEFDLELLFSCIAEHHESKLEVFPGYLDESVRKALDEQKYTYKLCGAGGTGHLLVVTSPETRHVTRENIERVWGPELEWCPTVKGTEILYAE